MKTGFKILFSLIVVGAIMVFSNKGNMTVNCVSHSDVTEDYVQEKDNVEIETTKLQWGKSIVTDLGIKGELGNSPYPPKSQKNESNFITVVNERILIYGANLKMQQIEMFDIYGKKVSAEAKIVNYTNEMLGIKMDNLISGQYFIVLQSDQKEVTNKFII